MRKLITILFFLSLLTGCGRIEAPEERWFSKVRRGQLVSVPFSHELELLDYDGWRFLGKLPSSALAGEHVQFAVWHEDADKRPGAPTGAAAFNGSWPTADPDARKVEIDILVHREWVDGLPIFRYRAVVNRQVVTGTLDVPDSYRQDISVKTAEQKIPIVVGEPIPLGIAALASWKTREGEKTTFVMRPQEYRWFIQFDVVGSKN